MIVRVSVRIRPMHVWCIERKFIIKIKLNTQENNGIECSRKILSRCCYRSVSQFVVHNMQLHLHIAATKQTQKINSRPFSGLMFLTKIK